MEDPPAAAAPPTRITRPGTGIYLVTGAEHPSLGADDRLLREALAAAGVPVTVAVWTDPRVDWGSAAACVIRSVWDYHRHPDRFARWLCAAAAATTVLNPPALVTWNMHKRYLRELAAAGVPTVDTRWIGAGDPADLDGLLRETGWDRALLKPAVSASAWRTARVAPGGGGQDLLREILRDGDAMLQPYLDSVERDGEVSVVAIDGTVTHAARRASALAGDIERTRHGGPHRMAPDERLLAERVLALLPERPLYARIDLLRDGSGRLLLGELELIEPVLYLRHGGLAVDRLVNALRRYVPTAAGTPTGTPGTAAGTPATAAGTPATAAGTPATAAGTPAGGP